MTPVLPKLTLPKFKLTLPSSGKIVSFRPFIVKEEKILLMALESEDLPQVIIALKDIITECTYGKLDPNELPICDLCYIFLNLRAKSVGETSEPSLSCRFCETENIVEIDLTKIGVTKTEGHSNKIILEDDKGMIMKYPTLGMDNLATSNIANDTTFEVIVECIDSIYDGDSVYKAKEYKKEELIEFVENLSHKQFEKVLTFFSTMPQLNHEVKFKCSKCNKQNKMVLGGIRDFFL